MLATLYERDSVHVIDVDVSVDFVQVLSGLCLHAAATLPQTWFKSLCLSCQT